MKLALIKLAEELSKLDLKNEAEDLGYLINYTSDEELKMRRKDWGRANVKNILKDETKKQLTNVNRRVKYLLVETSGPTTTDDSINWVMPTSEKTNLLDILPEFQSFSESKLTNSKHFRSVTYKFTYPTIKDAIADKWTLVESKPSETGNGTFLWLLKRDPLEQHMENTMDYKPYSF